MAGETLGLVIVIGFGHDEIGDVFFLGLHGFNIKKHMQRGLVVVLLRDGVWGSSFPLSFLVGLRFGGYLNKTTMRFSSTYSWQEGQSIYLHLCFSFWSIPTFCLRQSLQRRRRKHTEDSRLVAGLPAWSLPRCIWKHVSPKKSR